MNNDLDKDREKLILDIINSKNKRIFLLYGEIGAGKTTFVRDFLKSYCKINNINIYDDINSPTFTICHKYNDNISHFDLYRLNLSNSYDDFLTLDNIGLFYAMENDLVFIEWSEKLNDVFYFNYKENIIKLSFVNYKISIID